VFFNAGYGEAMTVNDLAGRLIALTGSNSVVQYQSTRPGDVRHSRASVEKLAATGFIPVLGMDESLRRTLEYFRGALTSTGAIAR
jgi:UDP-glucose 4-epimerase